MNWLAHAWLSTSDIEFRLGNLLADLVKGREREAMPVMFRRGVARHQAIDRFTDTHPLVHRSRGRIGGHFPHAGGILVDIFYDHFLALDFEQHAGEPLAVFTARLYEQMRQAPLALPPMAQAAVDHIISEDRLGSYRTLQGIETTLFRLSQRLIARLGKDLHLERGVAELTAHFDRFQSDFREFFPQLLAHVRTDVQKPDDAGTS